MAALLVFDITVKDADVYRDYVAAVPAIIGKYGGEYLVRGGDPETVDGNWEVSRLVILQFESRNQAKAFLNSNEYAPYLQLRHKAAVSRGILVDRV